MKQQTKEIIFNGALKAFSERGFNETNMEEIAKVCGIAKGTLYYNFKNKQELYIYILKMGMERFVQDIHGSDGSGSYGSGRTEGSQADPSTY
ncbi:TetR/AcrR family transcriptional regulator [Paenibacillus sp. UKAQ_18]|nr:TetR/AcrR family transcriptional regulator [Paenibacillus sp. UKAQ_18]